ncbi:hypothetical protein [Pseudomonas sp. MWU12-2345]|uniref:hypothetical protein n=1 Tax=Pseudomonas sp. MWU12-2345 TaxID=2928689 RepID=UPI00200C7FCC|nr:hypothetical protein [Pseudomonas sp. MWU12-2345]
MAMTKCKECKKDVSSNAKACPHCGVSNPAMGPKEFLIGISVFAAIAFGVYSYFSSDSKPSTNEDKKVIAEQKAAAEATCRKDLNCWAEKHLAEASYPCQKAVEGLAKYSSEWTDKTLDMKFDHMRWGDEQKGVVIYIGDKIKYQNGFGAYQDSVYECTYDTTTKTVLDASARPGRLPS